MITTSYGGARNRNNSKGESVPPVMAEEIQIEIVAPSDGHGAMPFRLGDIELDKKFGDLHPLLDSVDRLRKEWKFQFKLIRHEWGQAHFLTMLTGLLAFLLGSISGELFGGGDAKVSGIEGITSLSGFVFFQLIVSSIPVSYTHLTLPTILLV